VSSDPKENGPGKKFLLVATKNGVGVGVYFVDVEADLRDDLADIN